MDVVIGLNSYQYYNLMILFQLPTKTAEKILGDAESLDEMWDKVVATYEKKKKTYADALLAARLTRILREGEYNYVTGEVKLWEPAL